MGSANKAKVAIANRIARTVYKILGGDEFKELGYKRGVPNAKREVNKLMARLKVLGMDISYQNNEVIVTESLKVNSSGVAIQ